MRDGAALAETGDSRPRVNVRVTVKAKNLYLAKFIEKHGSSVNTARLLGISLNTLSSWLNFRTSPVRGTGGRLRPGKHSERIAKIILTICEEVGCKATDLFPDLTKQQMEVLAKKREYDSSIGAESLENHRDSPRLSYEQNVDEFVDNADAAEAIDKQLKTLSFREREILKLRYGLSDGFTYTLDEVSHIFRVGRERIRQVEAKALRKLQQPSRSDQLVGLVLDKQKAVANYEPHSLPGRRCLFCGEYFLRLAVLREHENSCPRKPEEKQA